MAAIALITAVLTLTRDTRDVIVQVFEPTKYSRNIQIVLDMSARMGNAFENTTKLRAALGAIEKVLATEPTGEATSQPVAIALRQFGGQCRGTSLVLDFSPDTSERIADAVEGLAPAGLADFAFAINAAIADLSAERFAKARRRVVAIVGGAQECGSMPDAVEAVRRHVETTQEGLVLDFRVIGLGLTEDEKRDVRDLAGSAGGRADFVERREELDAVLAQLVVPSAVAAEVLALTDAANDVSLTLVKVSGLIREQKYVEAQAALDLARAQLGTSPALMRAPGATTLDDKQFREFESQVALNREVQGRLVNAASRMLEEIRSGDIVAFNGSADDYTRLANVYSENAKNITRLAHVLSKPRGQ